MAFFNSENADMSFQKMLNIFYYYYFISHVSKQYILFVTSTFSVTELTVGTILKTIFKNQGLT